MQMFLTYCSAMTQSQQLKIVKTRLGLQLCIGYGHLVARGGHVTHFWVCRVWDNRSAHHLWGLQQCHWHWHHLLTLLFTEQHMLLFLNICVWVSLDKCAGLACFRSIGTWAFQEPCCYWVYGHLGAIEGCLTHCWVAIGRVSMHFGVHLGLNNRCVHYLQAWGQCHWHCLLGTSIVFYRTSVGEVQFQTESNLVWDQTQTRNFVSVWKILSETKWFGLQFQPQVSATNCSKPCLNHVMSLLLTCTLFTCFSL